MAAISHLLKFPDFNQHDLSEREVIMLLYNLTGFSYTFARCSSMRWGKEGVIVDMKSPNEDGFFQLMPHTVDNGFFDWYCYQREDQQFFSSMESAALHFIHYWMKWDFEGRPKAV